MRTQDTAVILEDTEEQCAKLEATNAALLEALTGMLTIHEADMKEAGFNPPTCSCELCTNAKETMASQ